MQARFGNVVGWLVERRWVVVPAYFVLSVALLVGLGPQLGRELFPQVDSGEFVVRFRAPPGSNFEITRQVWAKSLQVIQEEAGAENVAISMGFAGQVSPLFSVNNLILFMRGPDDGQMRVALREDSGIRLQPFRERLRKALPEKVKPWLTELLQRQGLTKESATARAEQLIFGFEPGDMVSTVMSFGSPAPIEVVVAGPNLADSRSHAQRILAAMKKIPSLRDVKFQQELDYPTVPVEIDRERAGLSGVSAQQVANAVVVTSSSSRYVARNFWVDAKNGFSYQVQVEVPTPQMNSPAQLETISLAKVNPDLNLMIRDVARVGQGTMPGEIDRTSSQRYVSITANVEGEDLGRAARRVEQAIADAGETPRGVRVLTRGQVAPMHEMFTSLGIGLGLAVVVILVLLTAYFESPRLALASVSSVPGVLCGVVVMLLVTGTTLNIESFMGAIMCIGVSVSNSVMLVTFIAMEWQGGKPVPEAARAGAQDRLRPILMTACAMTVGMVPMALALEHGSEMQAPLGRAVIGGLLASTFVTLLIVPSIFALLMGHRKAHSPSLYPDDPASSHYDPDGRGTRRGPCRGTSSSCSDSDIPWPLADLTPSSPGGTIMKRIQLSLLLLPGFLCGCSDPQPAKSPLSLDPAVKVVRPQVRTVKRTVEQPAVIGAYERTALYAKVSGFVAKWNVDIGYRVTKDETLVELSAPDLVAEHEQMKAQVVLDRALVKQSHKQHLVAQRNATAATEMVAQAEADVKRYVADVERWQSEVNRLTRLVGERVVDQQVLDETRRQLQSGQAALESSRAAVKTRDAQRLSAEATTDKTQVDISAAEAKVLVAVADERRLAALVDYLTITAPYDGVVFARNVNLGDFVTPAAGDPTQGIFSVGVGPNKATPLYVINRIDPVLVIVGVPEAYAPFVGPGTTARVRVPALANHEFTAKVTRTSGALDATSRTLAAQVELPNPKGKFLPGMYAYGSVFIERIGVRALPVSAVTQIGNQTYCYLALDGKAVRTAVQTGVSDGTWVEVTGKMVNLAGSSEGTWEAFDGTEAVIVGDLSELSDGTPVHVDSGN